MLSLTVTLPNEQHIKIAEAIVRWSLGAWSLSVYLGEFGLYWVVIHVAFLLFYLPRQYRFLARRSVYGPLVVLVWLLVILLPFATTHPDFFTYPATAAATPAQQRYAALWHYVNAGGWKYIGVTAFFGIWLIVVLDKSTQSTAKCE
jgi:hypothetical protein